MRRRFWDVLGRDEVVVETPKIIHQTNVTIYPVVPCHQVCYPMTTRTHIILYNMHIIQTGIYSVYKYQRYPVATFTVQLCILVGVFNSSEKTLVKCDYDHRVGNNQHLTVIICDIPSSCIQMSIYKYIYR